MKMQLQKPSAGKSRYSAEYKQQALEHWKNSGRSAAKVAAELGIRPPLLYRWARLARLDADSTAKKSAADEPDQVERLKAEVRRLSEENEKLLEQREILKKSLGILSETPPRGMPRSNK